VLSNPPVRVLNVVDPIGLRVKGLCVFHTAINSTAGVIFFEIGANSDCIRNDSNFDLLWFTKGDKSTSPTGGATFSHRTNSIHRYHSGVHIHWTLWESGLNIILKIALNLLIQIGGPQ
jgi:hypothetical protein